MAPVESARWLERALLPGAGLLLAFAALSFGATPAWARAAMELAVLLLLALWLLAGALRGELTLRWPALFYPMLAIFLLACVQAFARFSVYPPATRQEVWELLAVGGFFLLLHNLLATPGRLERFTTGVLLFAFALAVFAVLQGLSFSGKIYWTWEPPEGALPFGPFINRNHYAAWGLMLLPLAWVKVVSRHRIRETQLFWGVVVAVLAVSILLSRSRAGLGLLVLAFPLYWWLDRGQRRRRWTLAVGLLVVALAALATLALDTGEVAARWQTLEKFFSRPQELEDHRFQIWRDSLAMAGDRPWVGFGLETFGEVSDAYRSFYSQKEWRQAHNDYLQWLAETGLVGAILAVWFLVALARAGAEKLRLSAHGEQRRLVVGALAGCLLVLLHSLVDFPLRIPANALLFAFLWAVITAPATATVHGAERQPLVHTEFRLTR